MTKMQFEPQFAAAVTVPLKKYRYFPKVNNKYTGRRVYEHNGRYYILVDGKRRQFIHKNSMR